ncbi:SUS1 [[Candida] subhashii]|uniref:Transcription and mRNA export factor SUS1 n=1 Tax=[Candida] subhashii TaxID=561895 RepID=A0A8J5R6C0_9ASCO|nr:SUS1 [[Candida] subhashii]KAG7665695.1 SUS1 [[Candida] subhashii]
MTKEQEELNQIKAKIQEHLISSGNYDLINKQLKLQLYESGWFDKVSQIANRELNENEQNFDQLFSFVKPKAEELVPEDVKQDILERIKQYLDGIIQ